MTYGTLDDEKGKAAKPRGRRLIVGAAAVAALAAVGLTGARGAVPLTSPQAAFIKLPHKPPKVPTPPTPPTKPVTNTIPNHVPPVPPVPTASCTKLCPPGLIRGAVWGVSTCLQPKALFCEAACAKPVPSFAKFHGDCCPQGSWTAAAT